MSVSLMTVSLQNSFNLFHHAHSLQQGLCHISELSSSWLAKAEDVRKTFGNATCTFFLFKCPMFLGICYSFWLNFVDRLSKLEIVWMLSLLRLVTLFLFCILFSIKFSVFSICTFFILNFHLNLCLTKAYCLTDRCHLSTK